MRTLFGILTLSLLASCTAAPAEDIPADSSTLPSNVAELVKLYQEGTGVSITYDSETAELLASLKVKMVGPKDTAVLLISRGSD